MHTLTHIQAVYQLNIRVEEKSFIFVDIFDEILQAKIQFPQTRAQPIIPHQSFIQPNKFKYSSMDLLKANGIHWNGKNLDDMNGSESNLNLHSRSIINNVDNGDDENHIFSTSHRSKYYIKDKDRSLKVNQSFMDSLAILRQRLYERLQQAVSGRSFVYTLHHIKSTFIYVLYAH